MPKRWLTQTLILSLGLNCTLVALFFYLAYRDRPSRLCVAYKPTEIVATSTEIFPEKSIDELLALLKDRHARDSALATLVQLHGFDLERACGRRRARRLGDEEFKAICQFARTEHFPFTSSGLYMHLPEAADLFVTTPEFIQLKTLFARTGLPIADETLLTLAAEGSFETLEDFAQAQRAGANYGEVRRRDLLLDYIQDGARTAAYLLLLTDGEFAQQGVTDEEMIDLLQLLNVRTVEATRYVKGVLESSRREACKQRALARLKEYEGEEVAGRFTPRPGEGELRPVWRERHPKALPNEMYVVKEGDSLWLVAKRHNVSIEELKRANHLQTNTLRPNQLLKIPQSTGS